MLFKITLFLPLTLISATDNSIIYQSPKPDNSQFLQETFDNGIPDTFISTTGTKQDEDGNKYSGTFKSGALKSNALKGDLGLIIPEKAQHYGIATNLNKDWSPKTSDAFILSYEVNFQNGIECGGAYVKLFQANDNLDLSTFHDKTPFSIMFGPDKCSSDYKLHLILNHKNPKTGEYEEKHLKTKPNSEKLKTFYSDSKTHLYTLILKRDNSFIIKVDNSVITKGNFQTDVEPPINPPKEIEDESDTKPEDWDDNERIVDETDTKPEDWDESAPRKISDESATIPSDWREDTEPLIPDPESEKPEDWDEDMDGEYEPPMIENPECKDISGCGPWVAPMIDNPEYKGKWSPKMIKNPNYSGVWKRKMIENPDYFEDDKVFDGITDIRALGLELWTMSDEIYFDNFIIADDEKVTAEFVKKTFDLKVAQAKANEPSLAEKIKEGTKNKPWLPYVSAIVLGLIGIIVYFVFIKKSKPAEKTEEKLIQKEEDVIDDIGGEQVEKDAEQDEEEQDEQENEEELDEQDEEEVEEEVEEPIISQKVKETPVVAHISQSDEEPSKQCLGDSIADDSINKGDSSSSSSNSSSSDEEDVVRNDGPRKRNRRID